MNHFARFLSIAVLLSVATGVHAADSAADFYGNSLLCKDAGSGAVCDLWLDASGRYAVFYDTGVKAYVKGVRGDFQYEGRTGRYTATATDGGLRVCLTPDADTPSRPTKHAMPLFYDAGCIVLPHHPLGELWSFTSNGQQYRMGLLAGR